LPHLLLAEAYARLGKKDRATAEATRFNRLEMAYLGMDPDEPADYYKAIIAAKLEGRAR
jgi:hypothetical protein